YLAYGVRFGRCDPSAATFESLPSPPFLFDRWGGLRFNNGLLYGHSGNSSTSFGRFDIALRQWTALPAIPSGAVLGADIDPASGDYFTYGSYGGTSLYRFVAREGRWTVSTLPFAGNDGGIAYLSS